MILLETLPPRKNEVVTRGAVKIGQFQPKFVVDIPVAG
jgi:hypothetical protein